MLRGQPHWLGKEAAQPAVMLDDHPDLEVCSQLPGGKLQWRSLRGCAMRSGVGPSLGLFVRATGYCSGP